MIDTLIIVGCIATIMALQFVSYRAGYNKGDQDGYRRGRSDGYAALVRRMNELKRRETSENG